MAVRAVASLTMNSIDSFLESPSRFLFFTGKGGVGKTSLACAVSVALADAGKQVLLISTDPASNLGEVLGTAIGSEAAPIAEAPNLHALNIDPNEAARAYRERIVGPIRGVLPDEAVANIEEQLSGACTTEIASFNEFSRLIGDASAVDAYDHVILDTAPTGHTLRLLNLPAAWSDFMVANKTGASCLGPLSGLQDQKATYDQAVRTLRDEGRTTLVLVARADQASLKEAARASEELSSQGMRNQHLVVNAIFRAQDPNDALASALQREGEAALATMPGALLGMWRVDVPFRPVGTVGLQGLRDLLAPEVRPSHDDRETGSTETLASATPGDLETLVAEIKSAGSGVVMTMGKGGVGKTSIAIQVAQMLAADGAPVVLATTDPADHITGSILNPPDNLTISAIDPKSVTEAHVARTLAEAGPSLDDASRALLEEELRSPCIEEIAVFTAFAEIVALGSTQFVVLDTAPTGHTLLLLDTTEAYHRQVARNSSELSEEVKQLLPRLRDPEYSKLLIVTLAEATPVHEAAFLQEDLRRAGIDPYAWIINRSFHGIVTQDPLLKAKRAHEVPYLKEVQEQHARRMALVPYHLEESPKRSARFTSPLATI